VAGANAPDQSFGSSEPQRPHRATLVDATGGAQIDEHGPAVRRQPDIFGRHVTVDHPPRVQIGERVRDLAGGPREQDPTPVIVGDPGEPGNRVTDQELRDQEQLPIVSAQIQGLDDSWMVDGDQLLELELHARGGLRAAPSEQLQRTPGTGALIDGTKGGALAASAYPDIQAVPVPDESWSRSWSGARGHGGGGRPCGHFADRIANIIGCRHRPYVTEKF
jgi:hypothetical protein